MPDPAGAPHTAKILRLSQDLPTIISIVDTAEKIDALVPHLKPLIRGGLMTVEETGVILYSPDNGHAPA